MMSGKVRIILNKATRWIGRLLLLILVALIAFLI